MTALEALLARYGRGRMARLWIGPRPDGRERQLPRLIAGEVGYPTAAEDPFPGLASLTRAQAAHVLAVAGTTSLTHPRTGARVGAVREATEALGELGAGAVFFSNGLWAESHPRSWSPMSAATFDCGVIGYDADRAFIFWVEEED